MNCVINGKGSQSRNVGPKFQENFPTIDWSVSTDSGVEVHEERIGTKVRRTYGKRAPRPESEIEFVMPTPSELDETLRDFCRAQQDLLKSCY